MEKKFLQINQKAFKNLMKATEEIRKKAIKEALIYSLLQAQKAVISYSRRELKKSGNLNLQMDNFKKRVRKGITDISDSSPVPQLKATISFSAFDEALSSFPYKKVRIVGKNGRKYVGISPIILGNQLKPGKTFLRAALKGKAVAGTLLSLARTTDKRDSYTKQKVDVSVSDILLKNKSLFDGIVSKAHGTYEKRIGSNLNYYINRAMGKIK
jgi:hypothetical protein